jgi:Putative transposase
VVHCEPIGSGEAALRYLAPDRFRVAISNNRIVPLESGKVTFRYQASKTGKICSATVAAEEFIRRLRQHGLPDRFIKVRYYGLCAPTNRHLLDKARELLGIWPQEAQTARPVSDVKARETMPRCPKCGSLLILGQTLQPKPRQPPEPPVAMGGLFWTSRALSAATTMSAPRGFSASTRGNTALVERFIGPGSGFHKMIHGH